MTRHTRPDADRRPRRATRGGDRSATFGEGRRAVVLVVSTSGYAGEAEDATGPLLVGWLGERGYRVDAPQIVPDGPAVGEALRRHVLDAPEDERPRVIVTTGGTGLAPEDTTSGGDPQSPGQGGDGDRPGARGPRVWRSCRRRR